MVTRDRFLAITLTLIMVTAAGCAGWGTDSPADDQDQDQGNGDDLEEADGEAQADEGNGSNGSSSGANASDSPPDSSSSDTGTDSGDTEANTDTSDGGSDTASGGEDESTDETGSTGNGDSDSSADTDDSDSDSDSGSGDGDTNQDDEYKDTVEETERTLKVTVVDEDGNPIEGASVHATGPVLSNGVAHEPAGETNADGVATLTAYDGEYGVEAQHDGTTTDKKTVVVDGDTETTITIDTNDDENDGEETHTLTVTVLNPDDEPVEGLPVKLTTYDEGEPVATATTNENGQVTFEVEPDDYELIPDVSDSEYTNTGTHPVAVTEDTEYTMKLVSPPGDGDDDTGDDDAPYGTLTVTVEDSNGETVEGVEVIGIGPEGEIHSATADANGQATFDLGDGEYTYYVSTDGTEYADSSEEEITMDGSDQSITLTVQADDGDETNTLTVNLANDDIDGVAVTAEREGPDVDPDPVTKASAGGQVTFRLDPGYYHVSANEYNDTQVAIDVTEDNEITLQKPDAQPVTFTVTDAETSDSIEGAEVSGECDLWYSSGDVYIEGDGTTNENGVVEAMTGVTPTTCNPVRVTADGYETTNVSVSVPDDESVAVELTPEQDGGDGNTATTECAAFDSYEEAQSHFEEASIERGHLDGDNDGVACEDLPADGEMPDAVGLVVVHDQDGNPVEGEQVTIEFEDGSTSDYETNANGVVSLPYTFDDPMDVVPLTITVREQEQTIIVETGKNNGSDDGNRASFTVEPAVAQSQTSLTAAVA